MLRTTLTAAFATLSTTAFAHPGHIANVGHGHDHFLTISALVVVAIAGTVYATKRFYS